MNLSIKNAPDDLVRRLKLRAERNHRSLQGELMAIIEAAAYALPRRTSREIDAAGEPGPGTQDEALAPIRADWPPQLRGWQGVSEMPPFESHRGELLPPNDDTFS